MPITFSSLSTTGSAPQLLFRMTPAAAARWAVWLQDFTFAVIISLTFTLNVLSDIDPIKN
jgi:hypothetical protein